MKHRLEITVNNKAGKRKYRKVGPRPLIEKGDSPDVLSRRKGGFINFWDMGQLRDGSAYNDIFYAANNAPQNAGGDVQSAAAMTVADFNARDAPILAIPRGQWKSKFRKVTKGDLSAKYVIAAACSSFNGLLDSLSQWTSSGLKVDQADLNDGLTIGGNAILARNPFFCEGFTLKDGQPNIKITATDNYSDASVAFSPSRTMDVFFLPRFVFMRGTVINATFGDKWHYGDINLTFPRRFIINSNDLFEDGGAADPSPPAVTDALSSDFFTALANWRTFVSGREYHYTYPIAWASEPGSFPPAANPSRKGGIGISLLPIEFPDPHLPNGSLLAVVQKDGSFFYFWTDGF